MLAHREQVAEVEGSACAISVTPYQFDICRKLKRKQLADESSNEDEVTFTDGSQGFKVEAYCHFGQAQMPTQRTDAYKEVYDPFGVIFYMDCAERDLCIEANKISSTYPENLDKALADELIQF